MVRAVSLGLRRCNLELTGFCVTVRLDSEKPRYVFAIEPSGAVGRGVLGALLSACDQELQAANIEYQAKRQSQRLAAPELVVVAPGEFERRRKRRLDQGAFDSQLKLPHLQPEPQSIEDLVILDRWIGEPPP